MGAISTSVDYHVERIHGQEIQKPLPKRRHALVQTRIIIALAKWSGDLNLEVLTEIDVFTVGDDWVIPDLAVARANAKYRDGKLAEGAELAVEIMSPGQTIGQLFDKCELLHAGGTRHCWVLWPQKRSAWEYPAGGLPLPASDVLRAGAIEVQLSDLFANLPDDSE
jgi:Uma2 family endonuclease